MGMHSGRDAAWRDRCANLDLNVGWNESVLDKEGQAGGVNRKGLNQKKRRGSARSADWRDRRLCGQVRRAVQMGLADCGDPLLQALVVESVEPAMRSSSLQVGVSFSMDEIVDAELLSARLAAVSGRLRADVSRLIHRKKTPQLVFVICRAQTQEDCDEI
ncbi:MAG: hypothetical protein V3V20_05590 [Algisphaera sp.]